VASSTASFREAGLAIAKLLRNNANNYEKKAQTFKNHG